MTYEVKVEMTVTRTVTVDATDSTEARIKGLVEAQALVGANDAHVTEVNEVGGAQ